jgi:hypothetical protein
LKQDDEETPFKTGWLCHIAISVPTADYDPITLSSTPVDKNCTFYAMICYIELSYKTGLTMFSIKIFFIPVISLMTGKVVSGVVREFD